MSVLLFDIGGTSMRMATGGNGTVSDVQKVPTPEHPLDAISALAAYVRERMPAATSAYGGIAGVIDEGTVRVSPNLPAWDGCAFRTMLSNLLGVPVHVSNDAELAALGEAVYGAGKEHRLVGYLGIGTGIGGANIADRRIVPHATGFEPGHQVLDVSAGETFEGLVSGHALEARFKVPAKELPRETYDALTPILAAGIYNVLLAWSPEVLVLGGSLMNEENGYQVAAIERALVAIPGVLPELPLVLRAELGDQNGLYGALAFAGQTEGA